MTRHVFQVAAALLCGVIVHTSAAGAASLSGKVQARDGARLPYSTIVITDAESAAEWRVASGELGTFHVSGLPPGRYRVRVEAPGFRALDAPEVVLAEGGSAVSLDPVLDVEAVQEVLTVMGSAPRDSLEAASIRELGARDVGEALTSTSGVWQLRKGAIANEVVLRGLQSRDLNVLVDGQRAYGACPNHMDPPAFHVDFAEVERIEVSKGPFDVRHQGSLGGVVNVVTRRPDRGLHANLTLGLGAAAYTNPAGVVSYGTASWSALGGGSFRRADPYRGGDDRLVTEVANYTAAHREDEAFRIASGWARAAFAPGGTNHLQASYTRQQADHVLYPYLMMDGLSDDTDRVGLRFERTKTWRLDALQAQAYFTRVDHWMTDAFRTSAAGMPRGYSMGTDAATRTAGGRVEAGLGNLTAGVEFVRRGWDTRTELAMRQYRPQASIPDVVIRSAGVFADWTHALGGRVTMEAGGRLDGVSSEADPELANTALYFAYHRTRATSRDDVLPSGRVRLAWKTGALQFGLGIGHTERVAEANERFFALQRSGSDWVGNPDLAPVRNTGVELSAGWARAGASVNAQVYVNRLHDYIGVYDQSRVETVAGVMNAQARSYANIDATLAGGELAGSVPVTARLFLSGDLSYVRGSQSGEPALGIGAGALAEMPALRGRARVRFDDGRVFAVVEEAVSGDQSRVDTGLGEQPTPGAALTNLSGGLRWRAMSVTVGVTNLFDRYYVDHLSYQRDPFRTGVRLPEPGRQWFSTVSWRF